MDLNLRGKVAIVTGVSGIGGGSGLGAAITEVLAQEGVNVAANYIVDGEDAEKFIDSVNARYGTKCTAIYGDISKPEDIDNIISKTISLFGRMDILVNNAGILPVTDILDMSDEEWDRVIKINLNGTFFFCKRFAKYLVSAKMPGRIVNISSKSGFAVSSSGRSHYATSKGGMITMTKALARELTPYGIIVNGIAPGILRTPLNNSLFGNPEVEKNYVKRILMGRLTEPREIANLTVFLASDKADTTVGSVVNATGGMLV